VRQQVRVRATSGLGKSPSFDATKAVRSNIGVAKDRDFGAKLLYRQRRPDPTTSEKQHQVDEERALRKN
jgi:hypothetical protein